MSAFRSRALCVALLLSGAPAYAAGSDVGSAAQDQKAGAQKTFEAGSKLYDSHRYEEALAAFRASYQIVSSPNSHLMIARCIRDLSRNVDAYLEFEAVVAEARQKGDRYESAAQAATDEMNELRPKIALLTVRVKNPPEGTSVKVGDATLTAAQIGVALPRDPGAVVVAARAPDGSSAEQKVDLQAGGAQDVELSLAPAEQEAPAPGPPPPPVHAEASTSGIPLRTWAYVAGGVGAAGLVAFGVFGAMSNSKFSDLESACTGGRCPPGRQDDIDAGKSYQTIANVGLVVGVLGLGAGATLFVLSSKESSREGNATARVDLKAGPGSLLLHGKF